MQQPTSIPR